MIILLLLSLLGIGLATLSIILFSSKVKTYMNYRNARNLLNKEQ